jgi:hypothetical protein
MPELKLLVDRDLLLVDPPPPHLIGQYRRTPALI